MQFYSNKKDTNIDTEFSNINKFNFGRKWWKLVLIIIGVLIILLILLFNKGNVDDEIINYLDLNGELEVSLYQNSDYIEFGYVAYNSKGEDLTNEVEITSDLNTGVIGEYRITYTIGDISKTRKVNVLQRPEEYVYIYLKTVNNDINIYLNEGDEYVDPGYQVFSSTGDILDDKVVVNGTVDTSKAGIYTIIYSVSDYYGNMVSAKRIVRVIGIDLEYTLSTNNYTNNDIEISLKANTDKFSYILLPNGDKVDKSNYVYKVSNNGKYQFEVFNGYGFSKIFTIEINNIDRKKPTGTCKVTHNENGSVINISASDSSGISKYVYNNKEYTSSKISLNEYIKDKVSVIFYDKVGNYGSAVCSVSEISDEYLVNTSYYSYNNGIKYPDIKSVNVTDLSCTIVNGAFNNVKSISVHKSIADNFHGILGLVCDYVNKTPWLDNIQHAGAFVNREVNQHDYHSKGLAIDINSSWTYTYNGKTYRPYSYQGRRVWNHYNDFICEVCDGKEDCQYNVNYIIFKRYFEGNGWCWGGNYGPEWFDPMHFELRDYGKCSTSERVEISCD